MKFILTLVFGLILSLSSVSASDIVQQYIVPQKTIEFDAQYFYPLNQGYFSTQNIVSQQLTEERLDSLENQLDILTDLLKEINNKLGQSNNGNQPTDTNNEPDGSDNSGNSDDSDTDSSDDPPITPEDVGPDSDGQPTELDIKAYTIFSTKCAACHSETKQEGGLQLINKERSELFAQNLPKRVEIYYRTNGLDLNGKKRMPVGGTLTDEEVSVLRLWLVEGVNK